MRRSLAGLLILALVSAGKLCAGEPATMAGLSVLQEKVAAAVQRDLEISSALSSVISSLQILDPLLSLSSDSELRVNSVRPAYTRGSWLLRMDCASRRGCLPFQVLLRMPGTALRSNDPAGNGAALRTQFQRSDQKTNQLQSRASITHSGDRVVLVEERSGLRIRAVAVCLQSGGLGDHIRVRNLASNRVLFATIAGKDLLRVD